LQPIRGWALRGVKLYKSVRGRRFKRVNVIGARLPNGKHCAVLTYTNSTNSEFFLAWFEMLLLPQLPKGSAIILDNASFHKKNELLQIAQRLGYILIFLPPYSPDKNPIEHSWANMKKWLRKNASGYSTIQEAVYAYFEKTQGALDSWSMLSRL
jgi:transposase